MNYQIVMNDELEHHGILGQKWGVRRYQNKDGSLTAAGKKRYYKEHRNDFYNKDTKYSNEYSKSESGKTNLENYRKAINKIETQNTDNWSYSDWKKNFYDHEEKYLKSAQTYVANKMSKEYSQQEFSLLVSRGQTSDLSTKEAIERYIEDWQLHTY